MKEWAHLPNNWQLLPNSVIGAQFSSFLPVLHLAK